MKALNNLKTNVKLIGGFVLIALLAGLVGGFGIYYIRTIDAADTRLYQNYTVPIMQLDQLGISFQRIRVNMRDAILVDDAEANQVNYDKIEQFSAEMDQVAIEYEKLIETQEMRTLFAEYEASKKEFDPYLDEMIALDKAGKSDEALEILLGDAYTSARAIQDQITAMMDMKNTLAQKIAEENTAAAYQATTIMLFIIAGSVLAALGLGFTISRSITIPLGIVVTTAEALSIGDLQRDLSDATKDIVRLRKDEIGVIGQAFDQLINYMQAMGLAATAIAGKDLTATVTPKSEKDELGNAFAKMLTGLREVMAQVMENADAVSAAAAQLASASEQSGEATSQIATTIQQVALGTAQQTAGVTKTSSAVEQYRRPDGQGYHQRHGNHPRQGWAFGHQG